MNDYTQSTKLSRTERLRCIALFLSGSSLRGIARYAGVAEKTMRRYLADTESTLQELQLTPDQFVPQYLMPDVKAKIDKRTADGLAGRFGSPGHEEWARVRRLAQKTK